MPTLDMSRILDNLRLIERQKNPTCTTHRVSKKNRIIAGTECGKPATVQVIRTCCDVPDVTYWCDFHTDMHTTQATLCRYCGHVCRPGTCFHRIIDTV